MIDLKDQQDLYDLLLTHLGLNPNDISLPELVLDYTNHNGPLGTVNSVPWDNDELPLIFLFDIRYNGLGGGGKSGPWNNHKHPWFDLLGWFRSNRPHEVGLRPLSIERAAQCLGCTPMDLAQLVYVHEVAHYLHFAQNPRGFLNYTPKEERTSYVESFAQLCTHAVARFFDSLGKEHLKIFDELCECQPDEYTYFRRYKLYPMERETIINYFLYPAEGDLVPLAQLYDMDDARMKFLIRNTHTEERGEMLIDLSDLGFHEKRDLMSYQPFETIYKAINSPHSIMD
jgi:hypothetical protein